MVTREELRSQLWPGDTFVDFDHGLNSAVQRLRDCLSDSADKPRWIETVPRRGYRFIGQVDFQEDSGKSTDPAVELSSSRAEPPSGEAAPSPVLPNITIRTSEVAPSAVELPSPATKRQTSYVVPALAFAVFVMVAITLFAVRYRLFAKSVPTQVHSIAVIPLNNISPDHDQEYFADGMTDELITMLAKSTSLRVVSRTSAMQYKGVNRPVRDIARELGVDAVLEGSVLRDGNHVHLNVQLVYAPDRQPYLGGELRS